MHIAIAGAGLLGRLLAFYLSPNHKVSVFDKASCKDDEMAAGWTAAGMLSPVAELESADDDVFFFGTRSLELWQQILPQLALPVEASFKGSLLAAHRGDEGAAQRLISLLQRKAPLNEQPTQLTSQQLQNLEPCIQGPAHGWLLANEGQIHTVQAMRALYASVADTTIWHWNSHVTDIQANSIKVNGVSQKFDWIFDVRGTGAKNTNIDITSLDCQNVRGVRGEVFWLDAPEVQLQRPVRLLHPRYRVYIVPRQDAIVIGASEIESEDRSPVSLRTTVELLSAAHSVIPALAEARIIKTSVNLRPALIDNLPRIENQQGLTRINGLFRHGWLIAPALIQRALKLNSEFS